MTHWGCLISRPGGTPATANSEQLRDIHKQEKLHKPWLMSQLTVQLCWVQSGGLSLDQYIHLHYHWQCSNFLDRALFLRRRNTGETQKNKINTFLLNGCEPRSKNICWGPGKGWEIFPLIIGRCSWTNHLRLHIETIRRNKAAICLPRGIWVQKDESWPRFLCLLPHQP